MDRENELILSGIGACPYCGQAVAVDRREGETPADAAARGCDCIGARQAREDARRRENARALIEELFGESCREADVLAAIDSNIRAGITAEGERGLAICAPRANALGMSYGQYMALQREGKIKR